MQEQICLSSNRISCRFVAFTLSTANIKKIYKGNDLNSENINILETGGTVNKKYIGPVVDEEAYVVLGEYQGKFVFNENGEVTHSNDQLSEQLNSITHINQLQKLFE